MHTQPTASTAQAAALLQRDAQYWTGAYYDPCGHSHETRLRMARERLAALAEALAGEPDAVVEHAATVGVPEVRSAARAELHRREGAEVAS